MQRLSMNLLIKNEADIIADNIHFHASQGVDCFVVMDNGSTDGTREIVESLKDQYEMLIIDRPQLDYQQSNWKTEMAVKSSRILGADWSIANDADEFWIPSSGSLKSKLTRWGSILQCKRVNMLPDERFFEENASWVDFPYRVKSPVLNKGQDIIGDDHFSVSLSNINGKVMVNNRGLIRVKGGNHRAWHSWGFINQKLEPDITVYHYPIRSRENFTSHIKNRAELLAAGVTKMGDHYRRWVRFYNEGRLDDELQRLALDKSSASVLLNFGVIEEATDIAEYIKEALRITQSNIK